jgi:hypothetical protein
MLGMVMCGPLKRKNAAEIQAAPLRYYLMEQGDVAGESVLVDWKPTEVFETIGPGPKADWTKLDFTEAIFARNKL